MNEMWPFKPKPQTQIEESQVKQRARELEELATKLQQATQDIVAGKYPHPLER